MTKQNVSMGKCLKITVLSILFGAVIAKIAPAQQPDPIHKFGIAVGLAHNQVRDYLLAPLRWDGIGPVLDVSYIYAPNASRHTVELRIPFAFMSNRYGHQAKALGINIEYGFLRTITGSDPRNALQAGGALNWSLDYQYYDSWDDSHFYWLNGYSVGPAIRWTGIVGQNQLAVGFNLPLLALVSRPPGFRYQDQESPWELLSMAHEQMSLAGVGNYLSPGVGAEYTRWINHQATLGAKILLQYRVFPEPERISLLNGSVLMTLDLSPESDRTTQP